jgi:hypothetical protein
MGGYLTHCRARSRPVAREMRRRRRRAGHAPRFTGAPGFDAHSAAAPAGGGERRRTMRRRSGAIRRGARPLASTQTRRAARGGGAGRSGEVRRNAAIRRGGAGRWRRRPGKTRFPPSGRDTGPPSRRRRTMRRVSGAIRRGRRPPASVGRGGTRRRCWSVRRGAAGRGDPARRRGPGKTRFPPFRTPHRAAPPAAADDAPPVRRDSPGARPPASTRTERPAAVTGGGATAVTGSDCGGVALRALLA